jgi:hypothetical protein
MLFHHIINCTVYKSRAITKRPMVALMVALLVAIKVALMVALMVVLMVAPMVVLSKLVSSSSKSNLHSIFNSNNLFLLNIVENDLK